MHDLQGVFYQIAKHGKKVKSQQRKKNTIGLKWNTANSAQGQSVAGLRLTIVGQRGEEEAAQAHGVVAVNA